MITGRDLIESQKLYSTGDDDLDELLEMAFCDGYEYAQYEFSDDDDDKKSKKDRKEYKNDSHRGYGRAILIGGTGGAVGRAVGKRRVEKYLDEGKTLKEAKALAERDAAIAGGGFGLATKSIKAISMPEGNGGAKVAGVLLGTGLSAGGGYLGTKRVNREWRRKHHDDDDD